MSERVYINHIIRLSTVDGPGARSTVFVQACNLACRYCHNPETQQLCRHCGLCVSVCPSGALEWTTEGRVRWLARRCTACDACINICPHFSSPRVRLMSAAEVFEAIRPDFPFVRGLTVSGGECTLYPAFLEELFALVKAAGKTTFMDANGTVDLARYPELMAQTDGVMLDIKAWKPSVFLRLTASPAPALRPALLRYLAENDKLYELRLVCLDGWVDAEACLRGAAASLAEFLPRTRLKLIAFRPQGVRGELAGRAAVLPEHLRPLKKMAERLGFGEVILR